MKPKISVIIPTYNDPTYLEESIRSVLSQNYPRSKYEILIIDGSTNDSILNLYKNRFSRIKTIRYVREKGCNLPEALNIGVKNMRGYFFKQLDCDDLLTKNSLDRYDKYISETPDFLVFYSDARIIDEKGKVISVMKEGSYKGIELAERIWKGPIGYPSSYIINKRCFEIVGTFNEKATMAEDWEWRIKAIFVNNISFYHIRESLISYRKHNNQKSTSELRTNSIYVFRMKKRLINELKAKVTDPRLLKILKISYNKWMASLIKRNIEVIFKLNKNKTYRKFIVKLEENIGSV